MNYRRTSGARALGLAKLLLLLTILSLCSSKLTSQGRAAVPLSADATQPSNPNMLKSGVTVTLTSIFLKEYMPEILKTFVDLTKQFKMIDYCPEFDISITNITLCIENQKLAEFDISNAVGDLQITDNSEFLFEVRGLSMTQIHDFNLKSDPEWFRDVGNGYVSIQNFNISLLVVPF